MSDNLKCPECGAPLPPNAPAGLCPRCVMALNLRTETDPTASTTTAAQQPPLPPEQIAPHFPQLEILELLGRGGMGVVYKARQKSLNRIVALKLLAPERVLDPAFAGRFAREAQALAALNHPNIVTVYDFGQAGGYYYLLMEFVDGANLRQLLRARKFTPEEALAVVPPLCDALQFAHDRGIVHRDIKPENLLIDKTGRIKVADFGISKILGPNAPADAAAETDASGHVTGVVGTPAYSAPEQKSDPQHVDNRADIYSLGVVFYEMLTGELPRKPLEPPSKKVHIDIRLDEIVLRALENEPERRYPQASEFKTQVETLVQSETQSPSAPAVPATPPPAAASIWKPANWLGKILQTTVAALMLVWFLMLSLVFANVVSRNDKAINYFGTAYALLVAAFCVEMLFRVKRAMAWRRMFTGSKKVLMAFAAAFFTAILIASLYFFVTAVFPAFHSKTPGTNAPATAAFIDELTDHAQAGDKWAQHTLWEAYDKGAYDVKPDSAKADHWLHEFTKDLYIVRFEPAEGFHPQNAAEYLNKIHPLIPEVTTYKNGLTVGSYFRTTKVGDKLTASFLTVQPDELTAAIKKNPNLKFISTERMPPEKLLAYENSPQESLDSNNNNATSAPAPEPFTAQLDDIDGAAFFVSLQHPKLIVQGINKLADEIPEAAFFPPLLAAQTAQFGYPEFSEIAPGTNIGIYQPVVPELLHGNLYPVIFIKLKEGGTIWNALVKNNKLHPKKIGDTGWTMFADKTAKFDAVKNPEAIIARLETPQPETLRVWSRLNGDTAAAYNTLLNDALATAIATGKLPAAEKTAFTAYARALLGEFFNSTHSGHATLTLGDTALRLTLGVQFKPDTALGTLLRYRADATGATPAIARCIANDGLYSAIYRTPPEASADYTRHMLDLLLTVDYPPFSVPLARLKSDTADYWAHADGCGALTMNIDMQPDPKNPRAPKTTTDMFVVNSGRFDKLGMNYMQARVELMQTLVDQFYDIARRSDVRGLPDLTIAKTKTGAMKINGIYFDAVAITFSGGAKSMPSQTQQNYYGIVDGNFVVGTSEQTLRNRLPALFAKKPLPGSIADANPLQPYERLGASINGAPLAEFTAKITNIDLAAAADNNQSALADIKTLYAQAAPARLTLEARQAAATLAIEVPYKFIAASVKLGRLIDTASKTGSAPAKKAPAKKTAPKTRAERAASNASEALAAREANANKAFTGKARVTPADRAAADQDAAARAGKAAESSPASQEREQAAPTTLADAATRYNWTHARTPHFEILSNLDETDFVANLVTQAEQIIALYETATPLFARRSDQSAQPAKLIFIQDELAPLLLAQTAGASKDTAGAAQTAYDERMAGTPFNHNTAQFDNPCKLSSLARHDDKQLVIVKLLTKNYMTDDMPDRSNSPEKLERTKTIECAADLAITYLNARAQQHTGGQKVPWLAAALNAMRGNPNAGSFELTPRFNSPVYGYGTFNPTGWIGIHDDTITLGRYNILSDMNAVRTARDFPITNPREEEKLWTNFMPAPAAISLGDIFDGPYYPLGDDVQSIQRQLARQREVHDFMYYCLFGPDPAAGAAFTKLVQLAAGGQPIDEPLFQKLFNATYAEMQTRMYAYYRARAESDPEVLKINPWGAPGLTVKLPATATAPTAAPIELQPARRADATRILDAWYAIVAAPAGSAKFPLGGRREAPPTPPTPPSGNSALPDSAVATAAPAKPGALTPTLPPDALIYDLHEVTRQPTPKGKNPSPIFPTDVEAAGAGSATIEFVVCADGAVRNIKIVSATQESLGWVCAETVSKWQYTPAQKDGQEVNCRLAVPFAFKLSDED